MSRGNKMNPIDSFQEVTIYAVEGNGFADWLEEELAARGWKPADLARASKLSSATVSRILNGDRNAGSDVALAIAKGLNLSADFVFRQAGLLPPQPGPDRDPSFQEIAEIMRNMTEDERREVVDYALYQFRRRNRKK